MAQKTYLLKELCKDATIRNPMRQVYGLQVSTLNTTVLQSFRCQDVQRAHHKPQTLDPNLYDVRTLRFHWLCNAGAYIITNTLLRGSNTASADSEAPSTRTMARHGVRDEPA